MLVLLSVAVAAWLMKRQEDEADRQLSAGEGNPLFLGMKAAASTYYREVVVEEAIGLKASALAGADLLYAIPDEAFAS